MDIRVLISLFHFFPQPCLQRMPLCLILFSDKASTTQLWTVLWRSISTASKHRASYCKPLLCFVWVAWPLTPGPLREPSDWLMGQSWRDRKSLNSVRSPLFLSVSGAPSSPTGPWAILLLLSLSTKDTLHINSALYRLELALVFVNTKSQSTGSHN